jgi:mitogen-activated protein kinase kinase
MKRPEDRATYAELLEHEFLRDDPTSNVDMVGWVEKALKWIDSRRSGGTSTDGIERKDSSLSADTTPAS